jgi:CheY-like chemotaxis protein
VLVVDDEPLLRQNTARVLARLGHTVVTAADGAEALEVFKERASEITLVVLDMSMPVMDGPECFERMRAIRTVPTLLVSGYTDDAVTQRLIAQGAARFLEKPYGLKAFRAVVAALLEDTTTGSS